MSISGLPISQTAAGAVRLSVQEEVVGPRRQEGRRETAWSSATDSTTKKRRTKTYRRQHKNYITRFYFWRLITELHFIFGLYIIINSYITRFGLCRIFFTLHDLASFVQIRALDRREWSQPKPRWSSTEREAPKQSSHVKHATTDTTTTTTNNNHKQQSHTNTYHTTPTHTAQTPHFFSGCVFPARPSLKADGECCDGGGWGMGVSVCLPLLSVYLSVYLSICLSVSVHS